MNSRLKQMYMLQAVLAASRTPSDIPGVAVGAVVVRNYEIIGRGHRRKIEGTNFIYHAERIAIEEAGNAKGGTMLVTHEPCASTKKDIMMQSCSDLIISSGIEQVVYGSVPTWPEAQNGSGVDKLRRAGVSVEKYDGLARQIKNLGNDILPQTTGL